MKVDDSAEQAMQIQLMAAMMKEMMGSSSIGSDGNSDGGSTAFSVMLQSLTDALNGDNAISNGSYNTSSSSLPFIDEIKNNVNSGNATIEQAVKAAAQKYNVDENLINAVINQESSFNPNATSKCGAMGLMQLMPDTAKGLGVTDAYNVSENVDGGTKYLKELLDMYGGSKELALSAYNAGPNAVSTRGVKTKEDIYKMPAETRDYVSKIMKNYGK